MVSTTKQGKQAGKHYWAEYRTEALATRVGVAAAAEQLGLHESQLYAWLLLDVMEGNQTFFMREDWVGRAGSIVDPVVAQLDQRPPAGFADYAAGSWGYQDATPLLERDRPRWKFG